MTQAGESLIDILLHVVFPCMKVMVMAQLCIYYNVRKDLCLTFPLHCAFPFHVLTAVRTAALNTQ